MLAQPLVMSDQQGGALFWFGALHHGTVESTVLPLTVSVLWLTTAQSGSVEPGLVATLPTTQGGCSEALIRSPMRIREPAKLWSQIESARPLAPNCCTSCWTRIAGSAKLLSVAVHECEISGHGQDVAPQDMSALLGFFQCTS